MAPDVSESRLPVGSWPLTFEVLVISLDIPSSYVATDGTTGAPYILARGVTVISDIDLTPLTATNPVGTTHTVTATVTTDSPVAGSPVVGTTVSFSVISGPNTGAVGTCSVSVTCLTDASGQVSWTYTDTGGPGTDTIEATFVASSGATQRSNRVEKIWEVPVGADISVAKTCAATAVPGGTFSCTVTVTNLGPAAATGVSVTITETGALIASATPSQGTCGATPTASLTCALGNLAVSASATVTITVQTGVAPGSVSDSATASASATETDPDPANNTATATTGVVVPASTVGCKITDGGRITAANGDKATFGANAQAPNKGQQQYQDHGPAININVHSISITAVVCSADKKSGSIFGTATINGAGIYFFRIDVQDLGEPGTSDTYRIRLSNGYDSGVQVLTGGNIQIHK